MKKQKEVKNSASRNRGKQKKMKVLVTGAAGFVGYHLVSLLLENPRVHLTLVDDLSRGKMDGELRSILARPNVKFVKLDLTDPASVKRLGQGYDHVYHLAAVNGTRRFYEMPHEVLRINILSLLNILEWMREKNPKGKILFTSSNEAYAGGLESFGKLPIPTPEAVPLVISDTYNPRWSYAATKLIGELMVIHYAERYNFRAVIVRPHNFYGPRAGDEHIIPEFSVRFAKQVPEITIFNPDHSRGYCYIGDAVRAMAMLMDSSKTDGFPIETVHIGDTNEITNRNLVGHLMRVSGWRPTTINTQAGHEGSVQRRRPNTTKLRRLVGWRPEVGLKEGLRRTYNWYESHLI
jgi:nucleoside-diphosphate-sugar epimerase